MERKLYKLLQQNKRKLSVQQYRTIKGQIRCGDLVGASKGLSRLLEVK